MDTDCHWYRLPYEIKLCIFEYVYLPYTLTKDKWRYDLVCKDFYNVCNDRSLKDKKLKVLHDAMQWEIMHFLIGNFFHASERFGVGFTFGSHPANKTWCFSIDVRNFEHSLYHNQVPMVPTAVVPQYFAHAQRQTFEFQHSLFLEATNGRFPPDIHSMRDFITQFVCHLRGKMRMAHFDAPTISCITHNDVHIIFHDSFKLYEDGSMRYRFLKTLTELLTDNNGELMQLFSDTDSISIGEFSYACRDYLKRLKPSREDMGFVVALSAMYPSYARLLR
jgi:hypothetical protein